MSHPCSNPSLIALLAIVLATASCKKTTEEDTVLLTDAEAAEIVETTVTERSAGLALATAETTKMIAASAQICGAVHDTTFQNSKTTGLVSYSQQSQLQWTIQCANLVPQSAEATITGNGTFATSRWSGDNQSIGVLSIAGLQPQSTVYTANGTYTRPGNLTGDLRKTDPTFESVTTVTLTALTISKSNYQINGGTGNVTVVATASSGQVSTLSGTLTFNGDGTATVIINGHSHTFPLQ